MSGSNCCFLTCIYVSQVAGQVVCSFHLFHNFPQFIVIHTIKGFGIVNKAEIDVCLFVCLFSWNSLAFFYDPVDVGNLISGSSAFFKASFNFNGETLENSCSGQEEDKRGGDSSSANTVVLEVSVKGPGEREKVKTVNSGRKRLISCNYLYIMIK